MKDHKKDLSPKYLLLALSCICILFLILSIFSPSFAHPVRSLIGGFLTPMQQGVSDVGEWVDNKMKVFGDIKALKEENEQLKEKVRAFEEQNSDNEAELTELYELRSLYALDEMYPEYEKTAARVFSVDVSGWFNEFYIDKGLNNSVYEGCNVLCDNGLLGIVVESYDNYAKVRAIIDDRSNVTAEIGSKGTICTVEGSLTTMEEGFLYARDIDKAADVEVGDRIITSSVSDRYLFGITIGYVTELTTDTNNLTKTAKITPVVDFTDIKDVLIITDRKREVDY